MAIYNNIYIVLDGAILAEAVSIQTALEKNTTPIFSVTDNFVGMSTGPMVRTLSVNNVIPVEGSMYPVFEELMKFNQQVEIMLQEGATGRQCITRGYITKVSRQGGVGSNSALSFEFIGTPDVFTT